jgi:two-component system, NarL family, response regulator NreC
MVGSLATSSPRAPLFFTVLRPSWRRFLHYCQILIADDHLGIRAAVRSQLQSRPDLNVCGEASNGEDLIEKALLLKPDLIILDIVMPLRDGFSATKEIKRVLPNIPVLLISTRGDKETLAESRLAGAQGFVSKFDLSFELLKAVDALIQGNTFFPNGLVA